MQLPATHYFGAPRTHYFGAPLGHQLLTPAFSITAAVIIAILAFALLLTLRRVRAHG